MKVKLFSDLHYSEALPDFCRKITVAYYDAVLSDFSKLRYDLVFSLGDITTEGAGKELHKLREKLDVSGHFHNVLGNHDTIFRKQERNSEYFGM